MSVNEMTKMNVCVWNATVFYKLRVWAVIYFARISILNPLLNVCFADQIDMTAVRYKYDVTVDARITMKSSLSYFQFKTLMYIQNFSHYLKNRNCF